jgi:hypothetical protein
MNHFTRLIDLTSADEEYVSKLATTLAPCILRPRQETSLTMEEKHSYRLIRDLFAHKDAIFSELKRMSTLSHSASVSGNSNNPVAAREAPGQTQPNRPRAISTDESNRKAHMEERTRALLEKATGSRSRATSPAPGPRAPAPAGTPTASTHRRDRSIGGPETRFPVTVASPTAQHHEARGSRQSLGPVLPKRASLDVPPEVSLGLPQAGDRAAAAAEPTNGVEPAAVAAVRGEGEGVEKRNSLGRSSARFVGGRRVPVPAASNAGGNYASEGGGHGVTLVDAPMDD